MGQLLILDYKTVTFERERERERERVGGREYGQKEIGIK